MSVLENSLLKHSKNILDHEFKYFHNGEKMELSVI